MDSNNSPKLKPRLNALGVRWLATAFSISELARGQMGGSPQKCSLRPHAFVCALVALCAITNLAPAQDAQVRANLALKDPPWVGQKITLVVELLAPGFFSGSPSFDLPRVPGVLIMPPAGSPVVGSEEIGGVNYTTQRHELSVFGQRAGGHDIPAFPVRFAFKRSPLDKDAIPQRLLTTSLHFETRQPPGSEKLGAIISARGLKVEETWKPVPGTTNAKAGDAFVRTLNYSAPDVPGMAFPPFPAPDIDGIGIYRKPPVVMDHSGRGEMQGQRQDSISYQCRRPGHFVVPAARFTWWDLDARQLKVIDFPARSFDVASNPAMASEAQVTARSPSRTPRRWAMWMAGIVLLGAVAWRWGKERSAAAVKRAAAFFRPIHLQPLNPESPSQGVHR